eukprot:EG_transcript_4786
MVSLGCATQYEVLKSPLGAARQVRHTASQQVHDVLAVPVRLLGDLQRQALCADLERWRRLQHRNVVAIVEVLEEGDMLLIAMAMSGGSTLSDEMGRHGMLNEPTAHRLFKSMVAAMAYCAAVQLYHLNLNPDCIYLDLAGTLKVGGFGLHHLHPTTPYLAPELQMSTGELTGAAAAAVDVWSLAVILHELLSGRVPLVANDGPTLPQHLSPPVGDLLRAMLHVNPEDRCSLDVVIGHPWFQYGVDIPPTARYGTPELQLRPPALEAGPGSPAPARLAPPRGPGPGPVDGAPRRARHVTGKGCRTSKVPSPSASASSSDHSCGSPMLPRPRGHPNLPILPIDLPATPSSVSSMGPATPLRGPRSQSTPRTAPDVRQALSVRPSAAVVPRRVGTSGLSPLTATPAPPPKRGTARRSLSAGGAPRIADGPLPVASAEEVPLPSSGPLVSEEAPATPSALDPVPRRSSATALSLNQSSELSNLKARRSRSFQPSSGGHSAAIRPVSYRDVPSSSYGRSMSAGVALSAGLSLVAVASPPRSRSHRIATQTLHWHPPSPPRSPPASIPDLPGGLADRSWLARLQTSSPSSEPPPEASAAPRSDPPAPSTPASGTTPVVATLFGVEEAEPGTVAPFL